MRAVTQFCVSATPSSAPAQRGLEKNICCQQVAADDLIVTGIDVEMNFYAVAIAFVVCLPPFVLMLPIQLGRLSICADSLRYFHCSHWADLETVVIQ